MKLWVFGVNLNKVEIVVVECGSICIKLRRKEMMVVGVWEVIMNLKKVLVGLARKGMVAKYVCELVTKNKMILRMRKSVLLTLGMFW